MEDKIKLLLEKGNLPPFREIDIKGSYPDAYSFVEHPRPLHFKCNSLIMRRVAKSVALNTLIEYMKNNRVKYPPYYLYKHMLMDSLKRYNFGEDKSTIEKWKNGCVIVLDGFDEISSQQEMNYIASFIEELVLANKPMILISSGKLDEEILNKYNAMSFGIVLSDIEEIEFGG